MTLRRRMTERAGDPDLVSSFDVGEDHHAGDASVRRDLDAQRSARRRVCERHRQRGLPAQGQLEEHPLAERAPALPAGVQRSGGEAGGVLTERRCLPSRERVEHRAIQGTHPGVPLGQVVPAAARQAVGSQAGRRVAVLVAGERGLERAMAFFSAAVDEERRVREDPGVTSRSEAREGIDGRFGHRFGRALRTAAQREAPKQERERCLLPQHRSRSLGHGDRIR